MSPTLQRSALAAAVLLILIGILVGDNGRSETGTTFGVVPPGYGALFDLLTELHVPVSRSYVRPEELPASATVWWIESPSLCDEKTGRDATPPPESSAATPDVWRGRAWVEGGGTAVILLPPKHGNCEAIAGVTLPRRDAGPSEDDTERKDEAGARRKGWGAEPKPVRQTLAGRIAAQPRQLATSGLRSFVDAGNWTVAATLDEHPFVLESPLGRGRLVVVGDATLVRNAWLDHGDAAVAAVDLVRAYGAPRFDERAHGLRAQDSALRYLAGSAAVPLFAGLALAAVLFAWRGAALPARALPDGSVVAPTLATFVESLAGLYASGRDYTRVLQHYRSLTVAQLRRHFRLPAETPLDEVAARVRETGRVQPVGLRCLVEDATVGSETEMRAAVRALDRLLWEVTA